MARYTPNQIQNILEDLVDASSVSAIISTLESVAYEKAEHVRENWQDEPLARVWERIGKSLNRSYMHVVKIDRLLP